MRNKLKLGIALNIITVGYLSNIGITKDIDDNVGKKVAYAGTLMTSSTLNKLSDGRYNTGKYKNTFDGCICNGYSII